MNTKKLLLLVDHFPPSFAPRMGYLAKYLHEFGWTGTAFSIPHPGKVNKFNHLVGNISSTEVIMPHYSTFQSLNKLIIECLGMLKRGFVWSMYDEKMYHYVRNQIKGQHFDALLCSTASFFPIQCATKIGKELKIPVILDFRDIYEQDPHFFTQKGMGSLLRKFQIRKRNHIIQSANIITTVSPWHTTFLSQFNPNTHLIYNGFDQELFFPRTTKNNDKFTITYTGSIAPTGRSTSRNPELLFEAIKQLSKERKINSETFQIQFYTDETSKMYISQYCASYQLQKYITIYDWVDSKKIPEILATSDLLLIITTAKNTHGILTTKLYEYLAMNKEILCITASESPIEKIISNANSGQCISEKQKLISYLIEKYQEWESFGRITCNPNSDYIRLFSRKKQAQQFIELFQSVLPHQ